MKIDDLIKALEDSTGPDQGLSYHNGRPEQRYDSRTGELYMIHDPTELRLFGHRADAFYNIIKNAADLAKQLRDLNAH